QPPRACACEREDEGSVLLIVEPLDGAPVAQHDLEQVPDAELIARGDHDELEPVVLDGGELCGSALDSPVAGDHGETGLSDDGDPVAVKRRWVGDGAWGAVFLA